MATKMILIFFSQLVTAFQSHLIYCLVSSLLCPVCFDCFPIVPLPLNICFWLFFYRHAPSRYFKLNLIFLFFFHNTSIFSRPSLPHIPSVWALSSPLHWKTSACLINASSILDILWKHLHKTGLEADSHMHSHSQ